MTSLSHPFHAMAAPLAPFIAALLLLTGMVAAEAETGAAPDPDLVERFEFLSQNGNSTCARAFRNSIADLPSSARLQGSCCGEMSLASLQRADRGIKAIRRHLRGPARPVRRRSRAGTEAHGRLPDAAWG